MKTDVNTKYETDGARPDTIISSIKMTSLVYVMLIEVI